MNDIGILWRSGQLSFRVASQKNGLATIAYGCDMTMEISWYPEFSRMFVQKCTSGTFLHT
jgi:hypothetical protein